MPTQVGFRQQPVRPRHTDPSVTIPASSRFADSLPKQLMSLPDSSRIFLEMAALILGLIQLIDRVPDRYKCRGIVFLAQSFSN